MRLSKKTKETISETGEPVSLTYKQEDKKAIIIINKYRESLKDFTSTDEQIKKHLVYLESFCRNVIRLELQKHVQGKKN